MAKNQNSVGNVMPYVAGSAITAGQVVVMGHTLGVALKDGASGETIPVAVEGVFECAKASGAVFVQGEKLVFDISANSGAGEFDDSTATPAAGDITGGAIAWREGKNGEATCLVKLTPGNATLTSGGG